MGKFQLDAKMNGNSSDQLDWICIQFVCFAYAYSLTENCVNRITIIALFPDFFFFETNTT